MSILRAIWIELGQKEEAEKLRLGMEGPFPNIPPAVYVTSGGQYAGLLSYVSYRIFDNSENDNSTLQYLMKATEILLEMFS